MTYYCKRHKSKTVFTFEGPDEKESGFWEHHRKVHGGTRKAERRMGIL